jgi:tetratricopeptide (TPR) repeat protein
MAQRLLQQAWQLAKALWKQAVILYRQWFWQPSNWLNYAEKQCQLGNSLGAIESCDQALKRDSGNCSAWYKKGQLLSQQQQNQEALSCFNQALKIDSTSHTIWFDQANVLLLLHQENEAIESYRKAIKIKPDFYLAWVKKGDLLSTQKPRIAADCYAQALKINQNDSEVSRKLNSLLTQLQQLADTSLIQGNQLCENGNFKEGIKLYDRSLELRPDFNEAWYRRGNVLAELQRYEEAINSYEKALKLKSDDYRSLVGKGNVFTELQRYQEALNFYNQALRFKPNDSEILRKSELAQSELKKLEISAEKLLHQGISFYNMGQYEEAIKSYDQALEFISKNLVSAS